MFDWKTHGIIGRDKSLGIQPLNLIELVKHMWQCYLCAKLFPIFLDNIGTGCEIYSNKTRAVLLSYSTKTRRRHETSQWELSVFLTWNQIHPSHLVIKSCIRNPRAAAAIRFKTIEETVAAIPTQMAVRNNFFIARNAYSTRSKR